MTEDDPFYFTPVELTNAIKTDNLEEVKRILKSGFDLNYYKIGYLCNAKSAEVMRELLMHGAKINSDIDHCSFPLNEAISLKKDMAIIRQLLEFGANVNGGLCFCYPPIKIATISNNIEAIVEILNHKDFLITKTEMGKYSYNSTFRLGFLLFEELAVQTIELKLLDCLGKEESAHTCLNKYKKYMFYEECVGKCKKELLLFKEYISGKFKINEFNNLIMYSTESLRLLENDCTELKKRFPIYADTVLKRVKEMIERKKLLKDLAGMIFISRNADKTVVLDNYSLLEIAKYLDKQDIGNFTEALAYNSCINE